MRGKIKFFSSRPFKLYRPRDRALLLLALYIVYIFSNRFPRPLGSQPPRELFVPVALERSENSNGVEGHRAINKTPLRSAQADEKPLNDPRQFIFKLLFHESS